MKVSITGGAGFIGSNSAAYYLNKGYDVTIIDNFSRFGSRLNVKWLNETFKKKPKIIEADLRFFKKEWMNDLQKSDLILHLAGQVAVTSSISNPREDFECNLLGTFNLLEAIRQRNNNPVLIYSSTNKVYGGLENLKIKEIKTRYTFTDLPKGVSEDQNLDFHSPYGCSKGAADQYIRDYARIYGLKTIIFRQSCIYGPRQFGIEDQGWLAWFLIALSNLKKITIYGNGKQVRDILYIDDLIDAYDKAFKKIKTTNGQVYNIGGGISNTVSVWIELKPKLEKIFGRKIIADFAEFRPGDQLIYVSNIKKAFKDFGWKPAVTIDNGLYNLYNWIISNTPR